MLISACLPACLPALGVQRFLLVWDESEAGSFAHASSKAGGINTEDAAMHQAIRTAVELGGEILDD